MTNKNKWIIIAITVLCCIIMTIVDGIIKPQYAVKSLIKVILFLALPFTYSLIDRKAELKSVFRINKQGMKLAFVLCIPVFLIIISAYILLKDVFDFSAITAALTGNIGVNGKNFIYVAIYISFVNSLLEEFFFRGFAFLTLRKFASDRFAYIFSSAIFALYHIAMMSGWFSIGVFAIILTGLFFGGIIFDYLNTKGNNIYTSWFVHMFANFAINTIGFMLFGLI